jgi:hypothetical protein
VDAALAEALAPVLRDLESSGSVIPEVGDDQWAGIDGQLTGLLRSPDGAPGQRGRTAGPPGGIDRPGN